ncbi:MAG: sodium:solute symporter, partial [Lewinella sp.]|nr:sodium:solute symporter [Lewinella sp.]
RLLVHVGFSLVLFLVILLFAAWNNDAVIKQLFTAAGYTYGPLLGLFAFGMFTDLKLRETLVIRGYRIPMVVVICLLSPVVAYLINVFSSSLLYGFEFGFLIIALNGLLTFLGLLAISYHDYESELPGHDPYQE